MLKKQLIQAAVVASCAVGLLASPAVARKKKKPHVIRDTVVAVFPFKVLNKDPRYAHYGEGASDAVINYMVRGGALKVAEESQLEKAIKALSRNQTGLFTEDYALNVGKMIDARFVVIGSVDVATNQIALNARVMEVETRQILVAERVHGPLADAFGLYDQLSVRISKGIVDHLSSRLMSVGGDDADKAAVARLLKKAKRFDPRFGGGDINKAVDFYKKAVLREPNDEKTRWALGQALVRKGDLREGRYNIQRALEINHDHAPSMALLGYIEDKLGAPEKGRQWYLRALAVDENYGEANFFMAANLYNSGRIGEAKTYAQAAVRSGDKRAKPLLGKIDERLARGK